MKAPFGLIFYELRAKRRAESEFDSFRPCFVDKTWIFRNSTGKRPLELIFGEFFTARCGEYEFDMFELFSDFSGSFFFCRPFLLIFFHFWFVFAGFFPHVFSFLVGTGGKEQRKLLIWKNSKMLWANFTEKSAEQI